MVENLKDTVITTFQDKTYANDVRKWLYYISLLVSIIDQVIKVILSKLAKEDTERLPSAGFKAILMEEALGQIQVAEAMLGDGSGDSGNCLHGDGTSKYHCHLQNL